jgi:hypothetical protein
MRTNGMGYGDERARVYTPFHVFTYNFSLLRSLVI